MTINEHTKISELIKENPDSINAIASINKHFEKLKNPILRRVLASRVTIADAARIGNCRVTDFFEKLQPLGFKMAGPGEQPEKNSSIKTPKPIFMRDLDPSRLHTLDVRPLIECNKDPFNEIMQALKELPDAYILLLVNSFEPVPLIRILHEKGYSTHIKQIGANLVHTWIKKGYGKTASFGEEPSQQVDLDQLLASFNDKVLSIDVRDLEMPAPMITILKNLEKIPAGHALYVRHKKVPQFLFPELRAKGYTWAVKIISENRVDLFIYQ